MFSREKEQKYSMRDVMLAIITKLLFQEKLLTLIKTRGIMQNINRI